MLPSKVFPLVLSKQISNNNNKHNNNKAAKTNNSQFEINRHILNFKVYFILQFVVN